MKIFVYSLSCDIDLLPIRFNTIFLRYLIYFAYLFIS